MQNGTFIRVFIAIWESLTVREQSRIVQLIVKQIDYNGATGRVTITFHPDGIKAIAMERRPELHEAVFASAGHDLGRHVRFSELLVGQQSTLTADQFISTGRVEKLVVE